MSELLTGYEAYLRLERLASPRTVKRYLRVLAEFERFLASSVEEGPVALDALGSATIKRFLQRAASESSEPSRASWNIRLTALSSFYTYLELDGHVDENPTKRIRRLKVARREVTPLSLSEMLRFLDALREGRQLYRSRNVAMAQVLLHTGVRVAELVSLDVDQVDFEAYKLRHVRTKGDNRLSLDFNDIVAEALEQYLEERAVLVKNGEASALFLSNRGTRISVRNVQDLIRRYAAKAGLEQRVTPHLFRHSLATELADMGVHLRVIQEVLGHSSVETTQNYTHVSAKQRKGAVTAYAQRWSKEAAEHDKAVNS